MLTLTKDTFEAEVEKHKGLVVIDLFATWCAPCRMLAPVLEELEKEYPDVKFCKINVDEERELAEKFRVESIPMVAFVKDDTFLDMSVGYVPKENLAAKIRELRWKSA